MVRRINYIFLLAVFFALVACDKIDWEVDCSECYQIEPEWGDLYVKVTINSENEYIPFVIYRGNIDRQDIEYIDTAYEDEYYLEVPLNQYYSVMAEYISGQDTIYAVDGDEIKTKLNSTDCDEDCYMIRGGIMDVRLKSGY